MSSYTEHANLINWLVVGFGPLPPPPLPLCSAIAPGFDKGPETRLLQLPLLSVGGSIA